MRAVFNNNIKIYLTYFCGEAKQEKYIRLRDAGKQANNYFIKICVLKYKLTSDSDSEILENKQIKKCSDK